MKKKIIGYLSLAGMTLLLVGCGSNVATTKDSSQSSKGSSIVESTDTSSAAATTEKGKGAEYTDLLTATNWQGTKVYDKDNNDLTAENEGFIGLAKYDKETGYYEFFDKATGETRGDEGTFFITADGEKRILISATKDYQAVVDMTEMTDKVFTYKRMGKDKNGKDVEVFVEHIPYADKELKFTKGRGKLEAKTGDIETSKPGIDVLAETLWNGTKVVDEAGNDVTEANKMFISLAKFDAANNKYEFFDLESGKSKGDFGYFDVLDHNKIRAHVSIGENKYGAALELTELNDKRFTYKRMGKDKDGKEITVFVEHEPYKGAEKPEFTF
ncbi:DUF4822 domain-containing protein [Vagococcus vulneris]|uniref:DUF4822 domain-containing protein n=1 Tax=Vagococcus vulneris TaxID=1977869 RepID=A0A429ZUE8_9ENTE|nr:DUF4822 domain-containing protein [Vagococcus vulneris]RST97314.1 DUF4822 domain-containing protein [Vagococcus vulneris]